MSINSLGNRYHPRVRLNSICPYFTMFPLAFPYTVLKDVRKGSWVLDPFCGRGTTNYAARLRSINSIGIDSNPVAASIAESKLIKVQPSRIITLASDIVNSDINDDVPDGEFWKWAYHEENLIQISKIRSYLLRKTKLTKTDMALKSLMLGLLHGPKMKITPSYLSNQMPRTYSSKPDYSVKYWKTKKLKPSKINSLELIKRKAEYFFNKQLRDQVEGTVIQADSRSFDNNLIDQKCDYIITSPPYYGMSTYEQDQWLRNWFLGGADKVVYSSQTQIVHGSEKAFVKDLSEVWNKSASVAKSNAKLVIRFGALPSKSEKSPVELIKDSLNLSVAPWKILTIRKAGIPNNSQRQSNQFQNCNEKYIEEIDVYAQLNA